MAGALERVEALAQAVLAKAFFGEWVRAERTISVKAPHQRKNAGTVTLEAFGSKEIEPSDGA